MGNQTFCSCVTCQKKNAKSNIIMDKLMMELDQGTNKDFASKLSLFDIVVNGKTVVNNYSGDGLILSSPIGSCAYNYSANGVILNEI